MNLGAKIILDAPISLTCVKHRGQRGEAKPLNPDARIKIKINIHGCGCAGCEGEAAGPRN